MDDPEREAGSFPESPAIENATRTISPHTAPAAAEIDPLLGQAISHYRVVEKIGGGGMGVVYKAEDTRLGRFAALKFLSGHIRRDEQALSRFQREARAASALNHPNIVTIYDIGEAEGVPFIAMELVLGRTMRSVSAGSLSIEQLAQIGAQAAQALAAAHGAGIVHRDIKPENIMVRDDGYVKILDFGLARIVPMSAAGAATLETQAGSTPGVVMGTPRYMSPEQARGEPLSEATDLFSLGLVLYELFTGKHPFHAASQLATMHGIVAEPAMPLSHQRTGIPSALETIVLKMIDKEARLRPSAADVHAVLSGFPIKSPRAAGADPVMEPRCHFVGRAKPMAELRAAFDSAAAGRGSIVCLAGEAGLGKTALVEDFLSQAAAREGGCSVARGRCSERLAGSAAYLPLLEALESLVHGGSGGTLARIMRTTAPAWYVQIIPWTGEDSSRERTILDTKSASQERMKRELAAFLQEIAQLQPLVLFLDDLHWADHSTVDLLSYVGDRIASTRILIVGTYRTAELLAAQHPFPQVKLDLQSRGICHEIALGFLTREDIEAYLAVEFPGNRFPAGMAAMIHSKTEGNALFVVDMVRYLRARSVIDENQGAWIVAEGLPDIANDLPETVRSMIQRNIERLTDAERRLLMAASVQGQEFDSAVIARVLDLDAAEVEEHLESLDRIQGFVRLTGERELPDGTLTLRYSFVHILYQNALYASITPTRRVSFSGAVAGALLDFHGDRSGEIAAQLALLFETARDFSRASEYCIAAGKNAARISANQEAIGLFQRAIEHGEKVRDGSRSRHIYDAAWEMGHVFETLTRPNDSADCFRRAEKAAMEMNDAAAQVHAICALAVSLFYAKRMDECREACDRADSLIQRHDLVHLAPAADAAHFLERVSAGDFETALTHSDRAVAALWDKPLMPATLPGINFRAGLHIWRLEDREGQRILDWTLREAREMGVRSRILQNLFFRTISLGHQGHIGEALETLGEARRIAELNGERFVLSRTPNTFGWLHRELFDVDAALELNLEGIRLAQQVGDNEAEINSHLNAGQDYLLLGEPERAAEHFRQAEFLLVRFNWFTWLFRIRLEAGIGSYWIAKGDLRKAEMHVTGSLEIATQSVCRKHMAWALKLKADIAALEDRVGDARGGYEAALGVLADHPCPPIEWQICKAYGQLRRRVGDSAGGDDQIRRARVLVDSLADSVSEDRLRRALLKSQAVEELT